MPIIKGKNAIVIAEIEPTAGAADYAGSYKPVGQATEHSISFSRAADETTTKDSGNYKDKDYGMGEGSGSISGLLFYNATANIGPEELLAAQYAGKKVKLVFLNVVDAKAPLTPTTAISTAAIDGDLFIAGSQQITVIGVITSLEKSGSVEGKATYSVSYEIDGAPTIADVAAADSNDAT